MIDFSTLTLVRNCVTSVPILNVYYFYTCSLTFKVIFECYMELLMIFSLKGCSKVTYVFDLVKGILDVFQHDFISP